MRGKDAPMPQPAQTPQWHEPLYRPPAAAAAPAAAAVAAPMMPPMAPIHEGFDSRGEQSVTASIVGTADELSVLEPGFILPAAEAIVEGYYPSSDYEEKGKREDAIPASLVPTDTDQTQGTTLRLES